jgi:rare lipoprotein A
VPPVSATDGIATWYEVPKSSLPERRAPGEFTAAYDRFPIGTYVRVTNKTNGRKVVVCITDGGVGKRKTIDLCKEAAEELGIVEKGEVKVQIEELAKR